MTAAVGFLLGIAAAIGVTTAFFQWDWLQALLGLDATARPVVSLLPVIVTRVL
ncbi:hypothetical protein [Streptomyces sp. NPDC006971]|uniref:hypothetical protein n=1 Tax=Streptomyces sp. NPDC006971 TaxID=3154784 RepID=UPI0033DE894E